MNHRIFISLISLAPLQVAAAQAPAKPVTIAFQALVGKESFRCNTQFKGLGLSKAEATVSEFRFYVHDLKLLKKDGTAVAVTMSRDTLWQDGEVALLDFESGEGSCSNGTKEERHEVAGTVPVGEYAGISFTLGVPFAKNHLDIAAQRAPLTLSRMYWSWATGYKFLRVDLRAQRPDTAATLPWQLHLGSTTCTPKGNEPTTCANPNRPTITLSGFDATRDAIALDLATIVANVDLLKAGSGCMSAPTSPSCGVLFSPLGLPFGESSESAVVQSAFRVVSKSKP